MQDCCQTIIFITDTRKSQLPIQESNMSLVGGPVHNERAGLSRQIDQI
jgi:hypothetical protein